jgi:hypothetical protein
VVVFVFRCDYFIRARASFEACVRAGCVLFLFLYFVLFLVGLTEIDIEIGKVIIECLVNFLCFGLLGLLLGLLLRLLGG